MFQTKHCKTVSVPDDLKTQLEKYIEEHPDQTLHSVMVRSMRLGLPLLFSTSTEAHVDRR